MKLVALDLQAHQGKRAFVRVIDESSGGWGHLNFDDFRFHQTRPVAVVETAVALGRQENNPILAHLVPNPVPAKGPGAEVVNRMFVEPGFAVDVVAAEPRVHQPIAFTFDERGRIWVAEGHSYPQKRPAGEGLDRIVILADQNGDGTFETRKVFMEGLNLVSGLEVGHGGVWIGAAPELLFVPDRNRDDRPDGPPEVLLDGFGFQDTHETLNNFIWGPDGWLYGNQGVFNYARIGRPGAPDAERAALSAGVWRYHPARRVFEVFASGGSNQWGLDFNEEGQLFMTHCRSRWGRGLTTHVSQGGHYWNQSNWRYADFVSNTAPPGYPFYRNYLLASARYGHGEGGAGKPGTRTVYGGHSHVGTMIYLGDNWPAEYRNRLFTHNLHGHQMNVQINQPEGSGYHTVHAGRDVLYSPDPTFVAVDLKYGPDGAVYFTDWSDRQHCHNPNTERWERGNGRVYRMAYAADFKPVQVDLAKLADAKLVELQTYRNAWHSRTARRLLQERALTGKATAATRTALLKLARLAVDPRHRLNALWSLHAVNGLDDITTRYFLTDTDEHIRAWTIQLLADNRSVSPALRKRLVALAKEDPSPVVRLYLASAIQRVPKETAWQLVAALANRPEDVTDRNLPGMIWFGLAPLMADDINRAFTLAADSRIPALSHYVRWYAAKLGGEGLERTLAQLAHQDLRADSLMALGLALKDQRGLPMPASWPGLAKGLYRDPDVSVQTLAHQLGSVFGDKSLFPQMRKLLTDQSAPVSRRQHAFNILANVANSDSADLFLSLLDETPFRLPVVRMASRFNHPATADALLGCFGTFSPRVKTAAMGALTSRASLGNALLDAVVAERLDRKTLTAFHVRQLSNLKDADIDRKLTKVWGKVAETPGELTQRITAIERHYNQAPQWAFSRPEGKKHFTLLCAPCHQVGKEGVNIGPTLTGSGRNGARYFIENIIDPNAVIGSDYEMSQIDTKDGEVVSGLIEGSTDSAVTIRTVAGSFTVPRTNIEKLASAKHSMMPAGLLDQLNDRQIVELLKYLLSI
jgi:putative membrane-bound dehydrogenase-like protein